MNELDWQSISIAEDDTHHLFDHKPIYHKKFHKVLKFHAPGLAPVLDTSGAYHIDLKGNAIYLERYIQSFGYYCQRAAVESSEGWFHLDEHGTPAYTERFAWCGNFQENSCTVKDFSNHYFHINLYGQRIYSSNYAYAGDYKEGYAVVCNTQGLQSHINHSGELLHGKWFNGLDVFHKSIARAKDTQGWFHIDKTGQALYDMRFNTLEPFYNNIAHAETLEGSLVTIGLDGKIINIIRPVSKTHLLHKLSSDLVGFWKTQTVAASVKLKILDHLPGDINTISTASNLPYQSCKRLLRGLQELGLVNQHQAYFTLTNKGKLLSPTTESSMAAAALIWSGDHYQTWPQLSHALSQDFLSKNYFSSLAKSPEELFLYHRALSLYALSDYENLIHHIDWHQHQQVIDAGGGTGTLLNLILNKYSHLQGFLLDKPEVIDLISIKEKNPRTKYIGIDFFQPWLYKADAILFARVLHDWPDEETVKLLEIAKSHLKPNGKIYILEMILSENTGNGGLLDLNMLVMTGGQERNLSEWKTIASKADLNIHVHDINSAVVNLIVLS